MNAYESLIRPLLFRIDAEWMHESAIWSGYFLGKSQAFTKFLTDRYRINDPRLETSLCGIRFPNPVGLAAGYDKNGLALDFMAALGFGFLEIGSVSARPSKGNPRPRLFRLPLDRAIVVYYGLPNEGAEIIAKRLEGKELSVPFGINIVKTNCLCAEPDDAIIEDYIRSVLLLKDIPDYLVLNLSCPNTEMGRDFFSDRAQLVRLLNRIKEFNLSRPLFLKVSPLGGIASLESMLEAVDAFPYLSGFIFNLPPGKPVPLRSPAEMVQEMPGAVSGKPVENMINEAIHELYKRMDRKRYCIIGVGGIFTAEDAYKKIRLGASLVQILTGLIYQGPGCVRAINKGLLHLLERDGFSHISEAVGVEM